jgi:hypothetical protein
MASRNIHDVVPESVIFVVTAYLSRARVVPCLLYKWLVVGLFVFQVINEIVQITLMLTLLPEGPVWLVLIVRTVIEWTLMAVCLTDLYRHDPEAEEDALRREIGVESEEDFWYEGLIAAPTTKQGYLIFLWSALAAFAALLAVYATILLIANTLDFPVTGHLGTDITFCVVFALSELCTFRGDAPGSALVMLSSVLSLGSFIVMLAAGGDTGDNVASIVLFTASCILCLGCCAFMKWGPSSVKELAEDSL